MEFKTLHNNRSVQLLRSFWNVQKNVMRIVQRTAADNGLSVPQYTILTSMILHEELTQKTLGEKTFFPKSTLSQSVDALVREDLLHRQPVEDNRREIQLSITEKGKKLLKTIHEQENGIHQAFREAVQDLEDEQFHNLLNTHLHIAQHLEAKE
ncbi:MarR family winged helix-turn-helix transcriptional regulator [Fictibacillus fluitans]|uniref:MarR family transcriptional regulator n=1 Tax=Fictibacillus fluitans TaxID=3058422 RepID=A0ABT8HQX9_9BACL|nr:MarR family transcriptional regulator [Fictibacillus sp. NE201]MDN4522920.1 MarR family transcriptional regulator [Fictibacillus sp. NE201]